MSVNKYFNYTVTTPADVIKKFKPLFSDKTKYDKSANNFATTKLDFDFPNIYYYSMQDFIFEFMWTRFSFNVIPEVYYGVPVNIDISLAARKNSENLRVRDVRIRNAVFCPIYNDYELIIKPVNLYFVYENIYINGHATIVVYDMKTKVVEFIDSADHAEATKLVKPMPAYFEKLLIKQGFNPNVVISSYKTTKKPRKDNIQREGKTRQYNPSYQKNKKRYKSIFDPDSGDPAGYCVIWSFMFIDAIMQNLDTKADQVKLRNRLKLALVKHIAEQGSVTRFVRTYAIRLFSCIYRACLLIIKKHKEYKNAQFSNIPPCIIFDAINIACPKPIYDLTLENLER